MKKFYQFIYLFLLIFMPILAVAGGGGDDSCTEGEEACPLELVIDGDTANDRSPIEYYYFIVPISQDISIEITDHGSSDLIVTVHPMSDDGSCDTSTTLVSKEDDHNFDLDFPGAEGGKKYCIATDGDTGSSWSSADEYDISVEGSADLQVAISDASKKEDNTPLTFTVALTKAFNHDVTINYTFTDGSAVNGVNFTGTNGSVSIISGELSASFDVPLINTQMDVTKAFTVTITTSTQGVDIYDDGTATGTIIGSEVVDADDSYEGPDICYDSRPTEGFCMFGMCMFYKETTNVRSMVDDLSNISTQKALTRGIAFMDFFSGLGTEGDNRTPESGDDQAEKKDFASADFIDNSYLFASMFPTGYEYRIGEDADESNGGNMNKDDTSSYYDQALFKMGLFTQYTHIVTYTKNGVEYQEILQACNPDTHGTLEEKPEFSDCGFYVDALNAGRKIDFASGDQTVSDTNQSNLNTPNITIANSALCDGSPCQAAGTKPADITLPAFRTSQVSDGVDVPYSMTISEQYVGSLTTTDDPNDSHETTKYFVFQAPYSGTYDGRAMMIKSITDNNDEADTHHYVFKKGDYWIEDWDISGSKNVIIETARDGEVRIFVKDDMTIDITGTLTIGPDQTRDGDEKFFMYTYEDLDSDADNKEIKVIDGFIYSDQKMTLTTTDKITLTKGALSSATTLSIENGQDSTFTPPSDTYNPSASVVGMFSACPIADVEDIPFFVDAVDRSYTDAEYTDANGPDIQTKVASKTGYDFEAVYLGADNTGVEPYSGSHQLALTVQVSLANADCTQEYFWETSGGGEPVGVAEIAQNTSSASLNETVDMPSLVGQDMRLMLKAVDWNILFDTFNVSNSCYNSSTTGSLCGVMSCLSAAAQAELAFPVDTGDTDLNANNRRIMEDCYGLSVNQQGTSDEGDDTVSGSIAEKSACRTANYTGNCGGVNGDIEPDKYEHKYGCLSCILDNELDGSGCSVDHFAIRPYRFVLGLNAPNAPLLRAGEEHGVSLSARDINDADTVDFDVSNFNESLDTSVIRYFADGTEDTEDLLAGTPEINASIVAYSVDGRSRLSNTAGSLEEIITLSYSDVGSVNIKVYDQNWSAIDNDDTPMDCDDSHAHTYICGEQNLTFIPHHFKAENIHLRDHQDSSSTYLSNDLNMSAHIDVEISAMNAKDGVTANFRQGALYYENPVSVDLNVTDWNASLTNNHPEDNDVHLQDISTPTTLGFGGNDSNGTHKIAWNDSNATQKLMFNYKRKNNQTVNPFQVKGTDINISVASLYTSGGATATIRGSGLADRNATFYFGRAKSSEFFYDDVDIDNENTPISVVLYCDKSYTECREFNNALNEINVNNWWLAIEHNETRGDGNITLTVDSTVPTGGTATVDTDVNVINGGEDASIYVRRTNQTVPLLVNIKLDTSGTNTNTWLIYDEDSDVSDPDPFYKVRFIGGSSAWVGYGKTGNVVDSNASRKKLKRLEW